MAEVKAGSNLSDSDGMGSIPAIHERFNHGQASLPVSMAFLIYMILLNCNCWRWACGSGATHTLKRLGRDRAAPHAAPATATWPRPDRYLHARAHTNKQELLSQGQSPAGAAWSLVWLLNVPAFPAVLS